MFTVFTILANWSGLDLDILREIAERITSLTDYIAFRRVCTSWKSATTSMKFIIRDNPNPNQMPVLLPAKRCSYNREFYSLSNHRIDEVYLPESIAKKCFSSMGWLITVSQEWSMSLLHPFSRLQIKLPHIKTFFHWYHLMTPGRKIHRQMRLINGSFIKP